ncbi:uncharacterized protein N7484_002086 [Penicillium longicatenatum]|uniref:uncharacterized protein n=1 Tax=Penicillium longicatenatum TaxID=1561947 RepID=UPI002548629C|nr:uncharacterized protein N7484_002086 [Penicillium longicatenatum]KAJ5658437.1 hypothetical protein N7484_002086 [Penicillium longicatenatum]
MYKRLSNSSGNAQLCERIHETCKGHLEWVFDLNPDATCSANVWIDGNSIEFTGLTDLPSDNPDAMPYHIMKAIEYVEVFDDLHEMAFVCSKLLKLCKQWFSRLKSTKNIRTPTWQHTVSSDIPIYRLSDHIWIWRTLKGVEDLISQVKWTSDHSANDYPRLKVVLLEFLELEPLISTLKAERFRTSDSWSMTATDQNTIPFDSEDIRKETLKRFTVKNDGFNRRMLSVTRSAIETRFLLHSRDTVLCYGILWGFYEGQSELLKEMLKIQIKHDDELCDEVAWKDPLRYGLALLLSRERCQLERMHSAHTIYQHARKVLLNSSSANGLFPGRLSDDKQGTVFEEEIDRDHYFHVGFEIPYILLRCTYPSETPLLSKEDETSTSFEYTDTIPFTHSQEIYNDSRLQNDQSRQNQIGAQPRVVSTMMKKQNPYAAFFDVNKIVDVQDEWLFKDPDFLDFVPPQNPQERKTISERAWEAFGLSDCPDLSWEKVDIADGENTNTLFDYFLRRLTLRKTLQGAEVSAFVLDICKTRKKKLRPSQKSSLYCIPMEDHESGFKFISLSKRRLNKSKKRLINLKFPTWDMGVTCYLATPERDRSSLASFIQRHGNIKASFFHDDVMIGFNTWTTEFHCRFYRAIRKGSPEWKMLEAKKSVGGANARAELQCSRKLGYKRCRTLGNGFYIVDDVFSLLMVGDWCDRYWTCHVFETSTTNSGLFEDNWREDNPSFPQRKVLELVLFNHLLGNVHRSTKDILNKVEQDPQSSSSEPSEELFSTTSFKDKRQELLDEIFQVLRILKDSIEGVRGLIDDWKQRESSQGRERPRWTRSDEQKYRKVIQTQTNELVKHDREINLLLSNIDFLISLVNNEKSLSQARDVTRFTYATVFFLPVGLAVSIFSMSGAPDRTSILQMIITAIVALSVTVAVLWYVMKAPNSMYTRGLNIGGLVQAFKPEQIDETTTKDRKIRDSASTDIEKPPYF